MTIAELDVISVTIVLYSLFGVMSASFWFGILLVGFHLKAYDVNIIDIVITTLGMCFFWPIALPLTIGMYTAGKGR